MFLSEATKGLTGQLISEGEFSCLAFATEAEQTVALINNGRLPVAPTITVADGTVNLYFGESSWALGAGVYVLPDIYLRGGSYPLRYSGTGTVLLTYREAVL